jgi:hypothetical protein
MLSHTRSQSAGKASDLKGNLSTTYVKVVLPLPNVVYGDVYLDAAVQCDGQFGLVAPVALEESRLSHLGAT